MQPVLSRTKILKTCGSLVQVKSIAECSTREFCNTFDLDYRSWKHILCLFLSDRLTQVLLFIGYFFLLRHYIKNESILIIRIYLMKPDTMQPVLSKTKVLKTCGSLVQVKSIAECFYFSRCQFWNNIVAMLQKSAYLDPKETLVNRQ